MASPYCVLPLRNCAAWKIGDCTVDATFVLPSSVVPFEKVILSGNSTTGTVVVCEPAEGSVPTIWNGYVVPLYVKLEVQKGMVFTEPDLACMSNALVVGFFGTM